MFPFPTPEMGENTLRHHLPILTLVETVDVFLIDSLGTLKDSDVARCIGPREGLSSLRPERLPHRTYEGLNRAVPVNQTNKRLGGLIVSTSWSPQEVASFISVVEEHEHNVYVHSPSGLTCIQYDFLASCCVSKTGIKLPLSCWPMVCLANRFLLMFITTTRTSPCRSTSL